MSDPCDLEEAVEGAMAGDDVTVLPGNYVLADGLVFPVGGVTVHGEPGARPLITSNYSGAVAILVQGTLRDVTVAAAASLEAVRLAGPSTLGERVFVQNTNNSARACHVADAVLRDSVCWARGTGSIAAQLGAPSGVTFTAVLRNVTAIASGTGGSVGVQAFSNGTGNATLDATNVIAQGTGFDATALVQGMGGSAAVNFSYSNYDTEAEYSGGSVTNPGTGNNQTTPPVFVDAVNGDFRQTDTSPTINSGVSGVVNGVDLGTYDLDGQSRVIDTVPDIGADEFAHPTTTDVSCMPTSLVLGSGGTQCLVFVTDTVATTPPTGSVALSSNGAGSFSGGTGCPLSPFVFGTAGCGPLEYTPAAAGTHTITGEYPGDLTHEASQDSEPITVTAPPSPPAPPPPASTPPPRKKCKKGFRPKNVKGKRKCVRKKKKK